MSADDREIMQGTAPVVASASRADEGGFNLSVWALRHQQLMTFLIGLATLFGVIGYTHLAQSEDPPFTFRTMVIQTHWPGATAREVQEQIIDRIGRQFQAAPYVDSIKSYSHPDESMIFFAMKDAAPIKDVPETWYRIWKKVGDIRAILPKDMVGSFFNDEFGDVYINIYALEGDGFSSAQLHDYADKLRTVLLHMPGATKVDYFGDPAEHVFIEISNAQLTRLAITPQQIAQAIDAQNTVAPVSTIMTADDRVSVRPADAFKDMQALTNMLITVNKRTFRLGDIAKIIRDYDDPPVTQMRVNDHVVLGIGVTMQKGGDVIGLGKALDTTAVELQATLSAGLKLSPVSSMSHAVKHSADEFVRSVGEAVAVVLMVSLVPLGLRTGMVVVISIPIVLVATALCMHVFDIGLDEVPLGTLMLALGLLVDDTIIAVKMMAVRLEQGWSRLRAAAFAYSSTAFPMLAGTLVTVSGFLPIALAKSSTGKYTRSIFEVSAISLTVSWSTAVVLVPLPDYHMLPEHENGAAERGHEHDIYNTSFYQRLSGWTSFCIRHRWTILGVTAVPFALAMVAFTRVPQQFLPNSERSELLVDLRLPKGASFDAALREAKRPEKTLDGRREIEHFVDYVGTGAPRFYLPLDQQPQQPNFVQFVITAKSVEGRDALSRWLSATFEKGLSGARIRVAQLENGPPVGFPIKFRVSGDNIATMRNIADKMAEKVHADARTQNVQFDWDEPAGHSTSLEIDQIKTRQLGVASEDVFNFLAMTLSGYIVTQYRECDKLINVDLCVPKTERVDPTKLAGLTTPTPNGPVPLSVIGHVRNRLEYGVIQKHDRQPTIAVQTDVRGNAQGISVIRDIDQTLAAERAKLPVDYHIQIGGAMEESVKGQTPINAEMPPMIIAMLTLLMIQLKSSSRAFIVVLTAPLGLIGVVTALLLLDKPFGFVALLGMIAMFGIAMRNSVTLVDQIDQDIAVGQKRSDAITGAAVQRLRPIMLMAAAAVLALIPLLCSGFFRPMATASMGGITIATVLTIFFLSALYAACFKVRPDERDLPSTGSAALES